MEFFIGTNVVAAARSKSHTAYGPSLLHGCRAACFYLRATKQIKNSHAEHAYCPQSNQMEAIEPSSFLLELYEMAAPLMFSSLWVSL